MSPILRMKDSLFVNHQSTSGCDESNICKTSIFNELLFKKHNFETIIAGDTCIYLPRVECFELLQIFHDTLRRKLIKTLHLQIF